MKLSTHCRWLLFHLRHLQGSAGSVGGPAVDRDEEPDEGEGERREVWTRDTGGGVKRPLPPLLNNAHGYHKNGSD